MYQSFNCHEYNVDGIKLYGAKFGLIFLNIIYYFFILILESAFRPVFVFNRFLEIHHQFSWCFFFFFTI